MKIDIKKLLLLFFLSLHVVHADFDYKVDNTNITISQGSEYLGEKQSYMYNYNRLRFRGDYMENGFFSTVIADGVNYLGHNYINSNTFEYLKSSRSDTPFTTQSNFKDYGDGSVYAKLYRLYGGYEDSKNRVVVGLQNISMGVGRIWTPTNLFNHRNVYALEPDEVFGVYALSYTRHLNSTSNITFVLSQKEDDSFKYGAIYKILTDYGDIAVDVILSDETNMIGYQVESNIADTGIQLRNEVAYISSNIKRLDGIDDVKYVQAIIGADYAFVNGINLTVEALYSSQKFLYEEILLNFNKDIFSSISYSDKYLGTSLSYSFNIFLDASILYVESLNKNNSRFISPSLTYTLNDNNSFSIGAQIIGGDDDSEFGDLDNTYFFKWALSF